MFQRHLRRLRRQFREQVTMMARAVARYFPEGTRLTRPDGGYLLWVQLPNGISGQAVYARRLPRKSSSCRARSARQRRDSAIVSD
jgi:DNA-binding transcriptional MocR family regulator